MMMRLMLGSAKTVFKGACRRTQMLVFEWSTSEVKLTRLAHPERPALFEVHSQDVHRSLSAMLDGGRRRAEECSAFQPVIATVARAKSAGLLRVKSMVLRQIQRCCFSETGGRFVGLMQERRPMPSRATVFLTSVAWTAVAIVILLYVIFSPI